MMRRRRGVFLTLAGLLVGAGSAVAQDDVIASAGSKQAVETSAEAEQQARTAAIRANPEGTISELMSRWAPADGASQLETALRAAGPGKLYQVSLARSFDEVEQILLGRAAGAPFREAVPNFLGDTTQDYVFTPVTPCRIFDTRNIGGGGGTPIAAEGTMEFYVYGGAPDIAPQGGDAAGCPAPAGKGEPRAVHLNLTVVPVGAQGNVRIYPQNVAPPSTSAVNFKFGTNIANALTVGTFVAFGPKEIAVQAKVAAAHVVGDVMGYYYDAATVGFRARRTSSQVIPSGTETTVIFNTEDYDLGSDYNNTTGVFTVPATGRYNLNCHLMFGAIPAGVSRVNVYLQRNGAFLAASWGDNPANNAFVPRMISSTWSFTAGDTITCRAFVSGAAVDVHQDSGYSFFSVVKAP